jgi:hypothetical protein
MGSDDLKRQLQQHIGHSYMTERPNIVNSEPSYCAAHPFLVQLLKKAAIELSHFE